MAGSQRAAQEWSLPHEMLDAGEIRSRYPTFTPDAGDVALYEAKAGFARPEMTVQAHLDLAAAHRVDLRPMLTHTFGLEQWRDAFLAIANQEESGAVKVAIDQR